MRRKKDNGFKAIVCLAVATIAVGAASIAVSKMDNMENTPNAVVTPLPQGSEEAAGTTSLDIAGASAKIKKASLNEDGTYTVVIAEEGYIGEMLIEATYSADGQTLVAYNVLSHTETDGIGTKVTEDAYKAVLAGVKLPVTTAGLDITAILGIEKEEVPATESAALKDGVYYAEGTPDDKGNYGFVTVTIENGKIVSAVWDEMYGGESKAQLSAEGKYVMKPVWKTQAESLGAYVVENQTTAGIMNETGYTDAVSGVSIYVGGFVGLVDQAIAQANGQDGTYTVEGEKDDKGNYGFVTVTIKDGKVANVVWDEMYGGESKAQLSVDGKYVMKPVWKTQAESLGAYVVENQTTDGIMNEKGYTDAVSGVSIYVGGFVDLTNQAVAQASTAALKDGVYYAEGTPDDKGNYGFVTVTIENGKIVSAVWDEMYGGESKAQLSAEGKYVMKPVWKTQAESLGAYVVENQTTAGIMNETGYTDAVSGVSIYVGGFVGLVDQAIAQANGQDGTYTVEGEKDDKGNYGFVTVTIKDGKVANVVWDEMYGGESKAQLSVDGKYVMKPVWKTQAESLGAYVVENQTTDGIMNEKGYTDAVSGVSIYVGGFVDLTNQAVAQASVTGEVPQAAAPVVDATKVDVVSGATFSSKAVIRAINEGFVFLRDCVLNK